MGVGSGKSEIAFYDLQGFIDGKECIVLGVYGHELHVVNVVSKYLEGQ